MIRLISIGLIGLVMCIPVAQAEQPYDIINCWSGENTRFFADDELAILNYDLKGVSRSNIKSGAFHYWSFQIIGSVKIESGKQQSYYYGKYLSPDGDFIVFVGQSFGDEDTWKFIHGAGKWKGITGGGKNRSVLVRPIKEGTTQGCSVATGTYELPK